MLSNSQDISLLLRCIEGVKFYSNGITKEFFSLPEVTQSYTMDTSFLTYPIDLTAGFALLFGRARESSRPYGGGKFI